MFNIESFPGLSVSVRGVKLKKHSEINENQLRLFRMKMRSRGAVLFQCLYQKYIGWVINEKDKKIVTKNEK